MKTLILLQAAAASSNHGALSFWLMLGGICTIAYLCVRYLKKGILPDKKNEFEDIQPSSQQLIVEDKQDNKFQQLRDLKNLLDEGVLTQEEFDLEKAKVLDV